ncbi:MAG: hypothetical protein U1A78_40220 [Polyangia bacterium]
MPNLSDRIRAIAPVNAVHYRLQMQLHDGNVRTFPIEEGDYFHVGEPPHDAPAGTYLLSFYDESFSLISNHDQTFVINARSEKAQGPQGQLTLNFQGPSSYAGASAASAGKAASSPSPSAAAAPVLTARAMKPSETELSEEEDPELRRHLYALDLEEKQQEFIRNSTYVKEVGEMFLLNRLMRREMMEMQRNMVLHSQTAFRDIAQIKSTIHGLMELQNSVIAHVEKHQKHPPPPPPDYVGLGHSAIALMKDVGVALIQRWPSPHAAQAASPQPQLPAAPAAQTSAPDAASPNGPPADALEQMAKRFRALSELELAQALSSPESWKTLLESFRKEAAPPSQEPEAAPNSASGLEG